uniref:Endonuclease/exonuclease/phosphatase domain-containing protein n=1 Tax=Paramoeba aestuarina TaxID=180227 RepID=A0A7S4NRI8_9EUKA
MADDDPVVRILTYNVNFGLARVRRDGTFRISSQAENIIRAVVESEADVVALQETNEAWQKAFDDSKAIKDRYPNQQWFHAGAAGGSAIISKQKFPILHSESLAVRGQVEGAWFNPLLATLSIHEKEVQIINVHLRPPKGMMFWTSSIRRAELAFIMDYLKKKKESILEGPMVVLGDFNEEDGYSAMEYLGKDFNMGDALVMHVPKSQETIEVDVPVIWGFTWNRKFRIDHICFTKKHFECLDGKILQGYTGKEGGSDHLPLVSNLRLK